MFRRVKEQVEANIRNAEEAVLQQQQKQKAAEAIATQQKAQEQLKFEGKRFFQKQQAKELLLQIGAEAMLDEIRKDVWGCGELKSNYENSIDPSIKLEHVKWESFSKWVTSYTLGSVSTPSKRNKPRLESENFFTRSVLKISVVGPANPEEPPRINIYRFNDTNKEKVVAWNQYVSGGNMFGNLSADYYPDYGHLLEDLFDKGTITTINEKIKVWTRLPDPPVSLPPDQYDNAYRLLSAQRNRGLSYDSLRTEGVIIEPAVSNQETVLSEILQRIVYEDTRLGQLPIFYIERVAKMTFPGPLQKEEGLIQGYGPYSPQRESKPLPPVDFPQSGA